MLRIKKTTLVSKTVSAQNACRGQSVRNCTDIAHLITSAKLYFAYFLLTKRLDSYPLLLSSRFYYPLNFTILRLSAVELRVDTGVI